MRPAIRTEAFSATILGEITEQRIHRPKLGGVDHGATLPLNGNEPRFAQAIEMKGERIRSNPERRRNSTSGHPFRPGLHQQPKHVQTIVLRERSQCRNSVTLFHNSATIEITDRRQELFLRSLKSSWPSHHRRPTTPCTLQIRRLPIAFQRPAVLILCAARQDA
jgi:hypothetical protein